MGVGARGPAEATGKAVNVMRGTGARKAWRKRNIFGEADLTVNADGQFLESKRQGLCGEALARPLKAVDGCLRLSVPVSAVTSPILGAHPQKRLPTMTKHTLVAAVAVLLASPLSLSAQNPLVQSLKGLFDVTKTNIMATAEMLNDDVYAFRPTDEVRSTGEILAHIADWQFVFCASAAGEANPRPENFEETRTHKAEIIDALELGFAYCERVFARTSDAGAAAATDLFGAPNTVGGVLAFNSAHNYEHYGNLVTYMRINGIVPPSSR